MSDFTAYSDVQDLSWYSTTTSTAHSATPAYSGAGAYAPPTGQFNDFEEEAPLLEELGIDVPGIIKKTKAILLFQLSSAELEQMDMGGPLLIAAALGAIHLIMGKLHFGVILGWSVVAACVLAFVVNQLAGENNPDGQKLELYNVCCLLGYCMIPIVVLSLLTLLIPGKSIIHYSCAVLCVLWATYSAATLFVRRSICLEDPFIKCLFNRMPRLLAWIIALFPIWLAATWYASNESRLFVLVSPVLGAILFGLYMFILLVYGVMTFHTVPEAEQELKRDISEAREDLKRRGILGDT